MSDSGEEFWNEINLPVPPLGTHSVSRRKIEIKKFKKLVEDAITFYGSISEFEGEVKQLSQFLFLSSNQMRMMKGYHEMKKTHQVAERVKRVDIVGVLEAFNSYIDDGFHSEIRLPHRQNLDYVLIRLQGLAKVLMRLVTCSRKSAMYIFGLIRAGSFYIKGTLYSSSLAKIWDEAREMCKYTADLYNNLRTYREKLRRIEKLEWIADNCQLPENLNAWLGDEFANFVANEVYDFKMLTRQEDIDNFNGSRTHSLQTFASYCEEGDNAETPTAELADAIAVKVKIEPKDEIDDFTPLAREHRADGYVHTMESITTKERVKLFLKFEDKYRKVDESKSLTIKKIKKKEWKEMKRDFSNKLLLMQESTLLEYVNDYLSECLSAQH